MKTERQRVKICTEGERVKPTVNLFQLVGKGLKLIIIYTGEERVKLPSMKRVDIIFIFLEAKG